MNARKTFHIAIFTFFLAFSITANAAKMPETLNEGIDKLKGIAIGLPQTLENLLDEAWKSWSGFYGKYVNAAKIYLIKKIRIKEPLMEERFKKEKEETERDIKTQTNKLNKTLLEKFKELIK